MGIRGLTTFIQNRSHLYLEDYELHDTNIVLDGSAIACQLYKWHCKSNDCFGGDYDKYAAVIETFFATLFHCNVTPYIVFDGGYETRKMATVISRMKNKIKSAEQLSSVTEGSISVFPLFLRDTFQDIALKLHVKCVRCDFEGDTEVANIARTLNCPVLSYDSDFFIFDVLYIPFSTFELCTRKKKKSPTSESYSYIGCKIYRVEKFLKSFGGLDKRNLPILAVLLGNDYINRGVFSMFYRNLKIQKCHGNQNDQQKRIKSVIIWLQNESTESAIQKVLSRYKCKRRKIIAQRIQNAIKGYNCTNSIYLKYLGITPIPPKEADFSFDVNYADDENVQDEELDDLEGDIVLDSEGEQFSATEDPDICFDEDVCGDDETNLSIDTIFLENFRHCLYPPSFMDILVQNKYYCIPQVEDGSQQHSHAVSSDILRAIHSILRNSEDSLVCVARDANGHVKSHPLPYCDINMPSLSELQDMDLSSRQLLLLQMLKVDNDFLKNCLNLFPQSWHLFIIAIKYLIDKSLVTWPIVYALIICKIFLEYVDKHMGHCRSQRSLEKMTAKCPTSVLSSRETDNIKNLTIIEALKSIEYNDSLACLKVLMPYFHINLKMKISNRLFDRNILHSMAQFQSCLLHFKYLNNLLNSPFSNCVMSDIFNGTLIYNLSQNFIKRSNLDNYIALLLQDTNAVLDGVKLIIDKVKEHGNGLKCNNLPKRRKKKKKSKEIDAIVDKENSAEEETCLDPNNKYSVLIFSDENC